MTELSAGNHRQPASRPQRGFDAGSYVARRRLKHRSRSQRRARPTPALERAGPGPRVGRTRPQARPDEVGSAPLAALRNRAVPTRTKGVPRVRPWGGPAAVDAPRAEARHAGYGPARLVRPTRSRLFISGTVSGTGGTATAGLLFDARAKI